METRGRGVTGLHRCTRHDTGYTSHGRHAFRLVLFSLFVRRAHSCVLPCASVTAGLRHFIEQSPAMPEMLDVQPCFARPLNSPAPILCGCASLSSSQHHLASSSLRLTVGASLGVGSSMQTHDIGSSTSAEQAVVLNRFRCFCVSCCIGDSIASPASQAPYPSATCWREFHTPAA